MPEASPPVAHRIAHPSLTARLARAAVQSKYAAKRARAELARMRRRLAALQTDQYLLRQLTQVAAQAAPNKTELAAWPTDIQELADKIGRESVRGLNSLEAPVRDRDRQMLARQFPAGIEAAKNDPAPFLRR